MIPILAVSSSAVIRLDADGTIDPTFTDAGAGGDQRIGFAAVSGGRVILVGEVLRQPTGGTLPPRTLFARAVELDTGEVDTRVGAGGIATIVLEPHLTGTEFSIAYITGVVVTSEGGVVIGVRQVFSDIQDDAAADFLYKLDADGRRADRATC